MRADRCDIQATKVKQAAKKAALEKVKAEKAKSSETLKGIAERVKALEAALE